MRVRSGATGLRVPTSTGDAVARRSDGRDPDALGGARRTVEGPTAGRRVPMAVLSTPGSWRRRSRTCSSRPGGSPRVMADGGARMRARVGRCCPGCGPWTGCWPGSGRRCCSPNGTPPPGSAREWPPSRPRTGRPPGRAARGAAGDRPGRRAGVHARGRRCGAVRGDAGRAPGRVRPDHRGRLRDRRRRAGHPGRAGRHRAARAPPRTRPRSPGPCSAWSPSSTPPPGTARTTTSAPAGSCTCPTRPTAPTSAACSTGSPATGYAWPWKPPANAPAPPPAPPTTQATSNAATGAHGTVLEERTAEQARADALDTIAQRILALPSHRLRRRRATPDQPAHDRRHLRRPPHPRRTVASPGQDTHREPAPHSTPGATTAGPAHDGPAHDGPADPAARTTCPTARGPGLGPDRGPRGHPRGRHPGARPARSPRCCATARSPAS